MFVLFTPPTARGKDFLLYNELFAKGLHCLVLRMPKASCQEYEDALLHIEPQYRKRIIICDHYHLIKKVGLGGAHLRKEQRYLYDEVRGYTDRVTTSTHSFEELSSLPFTPTFAFLSPIYNSICKIGYKPVITLDECPVHLAALPFPVVALGGIAPDKVKEALTYGFAGVAAMGYFYDRIDRMAEAFASFPPPSVLSVAGHDPTSGAGYVADALNMEALGVYPLTIPAALTVQHEMQFVASFATNIGRLIRSIRHLFEWHRCKVGKIGLAGSFYDVLQIAKALREEHFTTLVWDPVLKPTKGIARLHTQPSEELMKELCSYITLITPNESEAMHLFGSTDIAVLQSKALELNVSILLTGRTPASGAKMVEDCLIESDGSLSFFRVPRASCDKHGTGCVLSTCIASRLAQGYSLQEACRDAQWYTEELIHSDSGLLIRRNHLFSLRKQSALRTHHIQYITQSKDKESIVEEVRKVLAGGVRWVQLRMKQATHSERVSVARSLLLEMESYENSTLIIDDDVEAVLETGAHGVHLGSEDMSPSEARKHLGPNRIIGGTCHNEEDLNRLALQGVDYIGVGPLRHTETKQNLSALLGVEGIAALCEKNAQLPFPMPIVAIGGVVLSDVEPLSKLPHVVGVAVSGAIHRSENVLTHASQFVSASAEAWNVPRVREEKKE